MLPSPSQLLGWAREALVSQETMCLSGPGCLGLSCTRTGSQGAPAHLAGRLLSSCVASRAGQSQRGLGQEKKCALANASVILSKATLGAILFSSETLSELGILKYL